MAAANEATEYNTAANAVIETTDTKKAAAEHEAALMDGIAGMEEAARMDGTAGMEDAARTDGAAGHEDFTKQNTLMIKGIAITMLVIYHCFRTEAHLNGYEVSFFPFDMELGIKVAESMNNCVGIFAFLSAFGLTRKYSSGKTPPAAFAVNQIVRTQMAFAVPCVFCSLISFFGFGSNPYGTGPQAAGFAALDFLGLSGLFETPKMSGAWWYISFAYVIILLVVPTLWLCRKSAAGAAAAVGLYLLPALIYFRTHEAVNMNRWLLVIPLGVAAAHYRIPERIRARFRSIDSRVLRFLIFAVSTYILFELHIVRRWSFSRPPIMYIIFAVLPVLIVLWLYVFLDIPMISRPLAWLGRHSANIFYVHTFVRAVWLVDATYSLGWWLLIAGFVLCVSAFISIALEAFKRLIRYRAFEQKVSALIRGGALRN